MLRPLTLLLSILLLTNCTSDSSQSTSILQSAQPEASHILQETLDSTIILSVWNVPATGDLKLNDSIAEFVLYNHFKKKGYYIPDDLNDSMLTTENNELDKLEVCFCSMFITEVNKTENEDAVILYWLAPHFSNGHCIQPHKAIISDSGNMYKISHEDFIPTNYAIDSIMTTERQWIISGYDYDCGSHNALRRLILRFDRHH